MFGSVADPHHVDADPDPTFYSDSDTDPDRTIQFDAEPVPTSHVFPSNASK